METIGQVSAAVYRNMQSIHGYKLRDLSINHGQHDFLLVISLREGISQKELSNHLCVGKSTTAKAVKELVNKGYVRKEKQQNDRRVERLYLTEIGQKYAPLVQRIFLESQQLAQKGISQDEMELLMCLMERVLNNLLDEKYENNTKERKK